MAPTCLTFRATNPSCSTTVEDITIYYHNSDNLSIYQCSKVLMLTWCLNYFLGKQNPKVEPSPSVLLNNIDPPEAIITFLAINSPKPVPSGRAFRALPAL